jgi:hypothetical protein
MIEPGTCRQIRVSNFPAEGETDTGAHYYSASLDFAARMDVGSDTSGPGIPFCAREVLMCILDAALSEGYRARFEVARSVPADAGWPLQAANIAQAEAAYSKLLAQLVSGAFLLPVLIWLIPTTSTDAEGRIEEFRVNPMDDTLFETLLDDGIVRISISEMFCDVMGKLLLAPVIRAWVRHAATTKENVKVNSL